MNIQALIDMQHKLADASLQPQSDKLRGKGLKVYPSVVGPTAHALGIPLTFHTVTIDCTRILEKNS